MAHSYSSMRFLEAKQKERTKNNVLVPVATAVSRGGPGVGRGDSAQKTGPEFGWGPEKRMSSEMH